MDTEDFLQADDINKVINVPFAVKQGRTTDDEIESFIGANSGGRQGRYYRLAATKFGLITNQNNHSALTHLGLQLTELPENMHIHFIKNCMFNVPIFAAAIKYLASHKPEDLEAWFLPQYKGSKNTAKRRFSTFVNYLRVTGFI